MTRILSVYRNCSRGGMATVYYNRAKAAPEETHDLVFIEDKGGIALFDDLPNVNVRITGSDRGASYIKYVTKEFVYSEIRITTCSDMIEYIHPIHNPKILYEFHTPFRDQMKKELGKINLNLLHGLLVPSKNSAIILRELLPSTEVQKVQVRPNLLDPNFLNANLMDNRFKWGDRTPILWIGRFDNQKNANDFLRIISGLPDKYHGVMVLSLNDQGEIFSDFVGDVYSYNLENRLSILLNMSKSQMLDLYSSVKQRGGAFCSTSVDESFGYTVAEAAAFRLPTIAFDVGALREHEYSDIHLIPVGDNVAAIRKILELAPIQEPSNGSPLFSLRTIAHFLKNRVHG